MEANQQKQAVVLLDSWAGRTEHPVTILREAKCGTRWIVRWDGAPCFRFQTGRTYRPPKHAVRVR